MKTIKTIFALLFVLSISAQEERIWDVTYYDIPADQIGEFVQTHKSFMNFSVNEDSKITGQWVYRHWYSVL